MTHLKIFALFITLFWMAFPAYGADGQGRATQNVVGSVTVLLEEKGINIKGTPNAAYSVAFKESNGSISSMVHGHLNAEGRLAFSGTQRTSASATIIH